MKTLTTSLLFLLTMLIGQAQSIVFDRLTMANTAVRKDRIEQRVEMFENGELKESLVSQTTNYQNAIHHAATLIDIFIGKKFKVILEHERKLAYILPLSDSLPSGRMIDSLLLSNFIDSIGIQSVLDSLTFYIDVYFVPNYQQKSIRIFYDVNYRISGYDLIYNPALIRENIDRRVVCRINYEPFHEQEFDWSTIVLDKQGVISLSPTYSSYKLINLLDY